MSLLHSGSWLLPSSPIFSQNVYFNANCMTRASNEEVICPNVFWLKFVVGFPGLMLFVTLNASARNSNF